MDFDFITLTDGYKLDHRRQYPAKTEYVLSNLTARQSRVPGVKHVVNLGFQAFAQRYLIELAQRTFFNVSKHVVLEKYQRMVDGYLGPNNIGTDHIAALYDYGKIPLEFWGLPEGTHVPLRVPMLTWQNTHPDFFWVVNYIESMLSSCLWSMITSATTAYRYREIFDAYARATGGSPEFVPYQAHDFSMRGLMLPEVSGFTGLAHLTSFVGSDSLPALQVAREYYDHEDSAAVSVPATEHAVMCAGGQVTELETFERLLALYPSGILSVVSDTWDLWNVIMYILPQLKDKILARNGKLVIRPDSGDPVDILCGLKYWDGMGYRTPKHRGVIEILWEIFGGTINKAGYRELDSHIGAIYGDSITPERAREINQRLMEKGFASTNWVAGVGSYTYQYVTRDTYGMAIKATWAQVDGQEHMLFKDPITDDGVKKSARGRLVVTGDMRLVDNLDLETERAATKSGHNLLRPLWREGVFLGRTNLTQIRKRVARGP